MSVIWKFNLEVMDKQIINMPADARLLCVQAQYGEPCLWALVDNGNPNTEYIIYTVGTGDVLPFTPVSDLIYIDTYQIENGHLIFHVFYKDK